MSINRATAQVSIQDLKEDFDLGGVGNILGFITLVPSAIGGVATGEILHRLKPIREVFVHLEGLSTSGNQHNGFRSRVLRAILV